MSGDVLHFKPKVEQVYTCACSRELTHGGQLFYLHANGNVECRRCGNVVPYLTWGKVNEPEAT